jgi:hydroxymethylpyrimidine/phosphomethylpyrimidine kinase
MMKTLVSIAGYDPSGGAGVLLDIRVFELFGYRGLGVLTAVTAQNAERVDRVFPVSAAAVAGQFRSLAPPAALAGIKVGMIGTAGNMAAVGRILARCRHLPRVVDPVLRASSGAALLERRAWPDLLTEIRGKADLVTPNLDEAEALTGRPVRTVAAMRAAAEWITGRSGVPCLVKGGHLPGKKVDVLFDGRGTVTFGHARLARDVHGTGCFLSAAVVAFLAEGRPLAEACGLAVEALQRALREAVPAEGKRRVFSFSREAARGTARRAARR